MTVVPTVQVAGSQMPLRWLLPAFLGAGILIAASVYLFGVTLLLLGIVAVLVLGFSISKPEIAVIAVIFILYANLAVVAYRQHGVPEIVASSVFLLLGLPLLRFIVIDRANVLFNIQFYLMVIYSAVLLLSQLLSKDPMNSLEAVANYVLQGLVLYFLVLNTIRTKSMLRKAIWTLVISGAVMGSLSLLQEVTHTYQNSYGGLAQMQSTDFKTGDADPDNETRGRLAGPIGETNRYAQIMVVLLPLALYLIWSETSRRCRWLAALTCIPILGGTLLTFSRMAGLAIVFTLCTLVLFGYVRLSRMLSIFAISGLLLVAFAPNWVTRFSSLSNVVGLSQGSHVNVDSSISSRASLSIASMKIFLDHPILGVGPGQTRLYIADYSLGTGFDRIGGTKRSHDMYVEVLADSGLIGFLSFMAIPIMTLLLMWKRRMQLDRRSEEFHLMTAMLVCILCYLFTACFLHLSYERYYWVLLALGGATLHALKPNARMFFVLSPSSYATRLIATRPTAR